MLVMKGLASPVQPATPRSAARSWSWGLLAVAVAVYPVAGLFSTTRAFAQRDLTLHFWPKYQWLRRTIGAGEWPWWDPYMAAGQSAAADALNQLFLLPSLALRLLLPEPLGFNLWVALPFPLAAWGTYLYLRTHVSPAGAALGAVTFAVAGPVVSSGNVPNLSWSVLCIPWLLWAMDRCALQLTPRRMAVVALLYGAQACAGEPVTLAGTGALLIAYAAVAAPRATQGVRSWLATTSGAVAALALGVALAAVQFVPLLDVVRRSARGVQVAAPTFWAVHPLSLLETIAPMLFGNFFVTFAAYQPWLVALNSGRDPFFYSTYVGIGVWLLAVVGVATAGVQRRFVLFWVAVSVLAVVGAVGSHTPIYPLLLDWFPPIRTFRFPAKYLVFLCIALATLVALGWATVERGLAAPAEGTPGEKRGRSLVAALGLGLAVLAYGAAAAIFVWPDDAAWGLYAAGRFFRLANPVEGAAFMMAELPSHATRLLLLSLAAGGLLWVALSRRPEARWAAWVLYVAIGVDLAVTNGVVNPMAPTSLLEPASWLGRVTRSPHERFYFGGRLEGGMRASDIDAAANVSLPPYADLLETRVLLSNRIALTPSATGAREMMSYELTGIWPREYSRVLALFTNADRDARLRLLRRSGVRYCVMREPLPAGAQILERVVNYEGMALFECDPQASRVAVIPHAEIVPALEQQAHRILQPDATGNALLMLQAPPPAPVGTAGPPGAASATFLRDGPTVVDVSASVGAEGGYLLLRDSYDPYWRVDVDGQPADLLRANVFFRAVRLTPGLHHVRFVYAPLPLYYGAGVSAVASLGVLAMISWRSRARIVTEPVAESTGLHTADEPLVSA